MAVGQITEGIKQQVALWMSKLQDSIDYAGRGKVLVNDTQRELDYTSKLIDALPAMEQYAYRKTHDGWRSDLGKLDDRLNQAKTKIADAFNKLKDVLGIRGLGIAPLIVFAIVGAVVGSVALLWNETVNKTRQISADNTKLKAVLEGKLPADVLKKIQQGGLLDWAKALPAIAIGLGLLFILPKLAKSRR